ncbi:uncharacterized protein [Lolium perenne]|uniref:uncharacterized protein n=1 Tax=Lolium perenne TaxID=4522 RepID=UPI0021F5A572|nr:uncharacterized protein LOC127304678 [Lolium perenne]
MQDPIASQVAGGEANPPSLAYLEPFARLVKLVGRAFYGEIGFKGDALTTCSDSENAGIAVVILDALTRYQWVEEDMLARSLKITKKRCLAILRHFEAERFLRRKKQSITVDRAVAAAVAPDTNTFRFYCCLDYPKICDIIRFKLNGMKEKLKCRLGGVKEVQAFICLDCQRRYSSFDVMHLSSIEDYFRCENCSGKVLEEIDVELSETAGDGRKRRRTAVVDLLRRMEVQLAPLVSQLDSIQKLGIPEFPYLDVDENNAVHNDLSSSSAQGAVRFLEETTVDKADAKVTELKILPEWMIKDGMISKNSSIDDVSVPDKDIQEAFAKAYREAVNKVLAQK